MKLITTINGRRVTPLRAAPFHTEGFIDVVTAAHMLADPDAYCDGNSSIILEAFKLDPIKGLVYVPHDRFWPLAKEDAALDFNAAREIKDFTLAPKGILIHADALRELFEMLAQYPNLWTRKSTDLNPPIWREEPAMPKDIQARVVGGLESLFVQPRLDTREVTYTLINDAFKKIEERARAKNISLDRKALPGVRAEFARLIKKIEPKLGRLSEETLADYAKRIGFGWLRGAKPNDPENLVQIFNRK